MSRKFLTPIDLNKLEIQNVAIQNLASDPATPATGQIYYNTGGSLKFYNGSTWQTLGTTAGGATLTIGTGLSGTSYNGSTGVTIAIDTATTVDKTTAQTLSNKSIAGTGLIFNGSTSGTTTLLANATAGTTTITFPATTGTVVTTGDSGTVTNTMLAGSIANAKLVNSSITIGTTTISLGGTSLTLAGLTSVSSTGFTGALTGNASTATALATARTINGTSFDGTANITITATATNALTIGTGLTGTSYNGSSAVTIAAVSGTTSTAGIVQLTDSTSSTSTTTAATPNSVKTAYDLANAAVPKSGGTMTGLLTLSGDPTSALHAATKQYVDNVASGVNAHDAVRTIFTTTIAGTYTAGSTTANPPGDGGTGLGATITFTATGATTNDTSVTLALNDRVLVTNGVTAASGTSSITNGIYYVSTAGTTGVATVLTRALDYDNSVFGDIAAGDLVYVSAGTAYAGTQWIQTTVGTATSGTLKCVKIGTDGISFTQFSGASTTTAGAGLVANGNAFDVGTASSARIVVNADNIDLATTAVSANSYGSSTAIPTFTVDAYGRLTAASSVAHTDATTSVKGIASFNSTYFSVTSGAVTLATGAAKANGAATKQTGAGTGTGTSISVNHALGQWVHAQLFETSTGAQVEVDVVNAATAGGTTTFTFATSQTLSNYTYVIIG